LIIKSSYRPCADVEEQNMVVPILDTITIMDDGTSLAGKHDEEDNAQEFFITGPS